MTTARPVYLFTVFALLLSVLFIYKAKTAQIYGKLDDTVNVSCQSVCIPDRYAPGSKHWNREDVVFSTGNRSCSELYLSEPALATRYAAEQAYSRLKNLVDYNFPSIVTGYTLEEFVVVNIISGKAYGYDMISGVGSMSNPAEEESYLLIKIRVVVELPLFESAEWVKEEKIILREEYN